MFSYSHWFVAGCYDGSIHIYSTPSGRLHTFFTIDSLPFIIQVHRNYLSVCSSQGMIYSWLDFFHFYNQMRRLIIHKYRNHLRVFFFNYFCKQEVYGLRLPFRNIESRKYIMSRRSVADFCEKGNF